MVLAAAADWYGLQLASHPDAGPARAHLRQRALGPSAARRWLLGYAPAPRHAHAHAAHQSRAPCGGREN